MLGYEVAGVVSGHGPGVDSAPVGQRVIAMVQGGGYAERTTVPAQSVVAVPDGVQDAQALAVLLAGVTATGLLDVAGTRPGSTVLVTAAAGGVGSIAAQLAKRAGATVVAAASPAKLDLARRLGADLAVDHTASGWEEVRSLTDGLGVDVILNSVGGDVFQAGMRLLAPFGRHVVFGGAGGGGVGELTADQLGGLVFANSSVIGFSAGPWLQARPERAAVVPQLLADVAEGTLTPVVAPPYPLAEAGKAHSDIADRRTTGKVVLSDV